MSNQLLQHASDLAFDTASLATRLALLAAIFVPLERLFALHPAKIWRPQIGVDLAWYFINGLVPAAILSVPLALIARAFHGLDLFGIYSTVERWPFWVKVPVALFVGDVGAYWGHRLMHTVPFLWRFHAIHHSAAQMDWLVSSRAHPFDIVLVRLSNFAPLYIFGLAQTKGKEADPLLLIVTLAGMAWTFFIHANVRARLGPLEWLISSPAFHHWHHTNDEHRDRNYSFIFPVIDWVFRTAWLPKIWPPVYGVSEAISPTLSGQFFDPLDPPRSAPRRPGEGTAIRPPATPESTCKAVTVPDDARVPQRTSGDIAPRS
jgi:sterol desaturase/sphingolipid hydroxylase (fatty acid hydroxylase superfamily)